MKREFVAVCASLFLLLLGTYISGTLLVPYATALGGTGTLIGVVYSTMYAVRLVFGAPIGRLSQRQGAKKILTFSMALFPVIALAYWLSWNMPSLLAARLLHGVASAMLLPMGMAYIGEVSPEGQEGRYMAIYNALLFASSAIGPLLGGVIYDHLGIRTAFLVLLALAVLSCVLISTLARGWTGKAAGKGVSEPAPQAEPAPAAGRVQRLRLTALGSVNVATAVMLALFGASFTQFALSRGMGMTQTGMLIAFLNITIGLSQIPFGRLADRYNKVRLTVVSGIAAAAAAACLPLAHAVWAIMLLLACAGAFLSLNLSAQSALSTVLGREGGMSRTMGLLGTANSAGTIVGYLGLGAITDVLSVSAAFAVSAVLFLMGIMVFVGLWKGDKPGQTPQIVVDRS